MSPLPPDMVIPFDKPLYRGMKGDDVKRLQNNLNTVNAYYGFYSEVKNEDFTVPESGFFDDSTIRLLKAFQKFCKIPPSGMYDNMANNWMQYKRWEALEAIMIMDQKAQQEAARIKEAEKAAKLARSMAKIGKLFPDGKFGN